MKAYLRFFALLLLGLLPCLTLADSSETVPLAQGWTALVKFKGECAVCDGTSLSLTLSKKGRRSVRQQFGRGDLAVASFAEDRYTQDLTAPGKPSMMAVYFSRDAHCCFYYTIYELGETAKKIGQLDVGDFQDFTLRDLDGNGTVEITVMDQVFMYWQTNFEDTPAPRVVFEFQNGYYRPSVRLIKKTWPFQTFLWQQAAVLNLALRRVKDNGFNIRQWQDCHDRIAGGKNYLPPELFAVMANLVYTGNGDLALAFLDKAWYRKLRGKAIFLQEFKERLLASQYSRTLKALNPKFF